SCVGGQPSRCVRQEPRHHAAGPDQGAAATRAAGEGRLDAARCCGQLGRRWRAASSASAVSSAGGSTGPAGASALSAADLAALVGGTLEGDPTTIISGVAPLPKAGPRDVSFYADARYADALSA